MLYLVSKIGLSLFHADIYGGPLFDFFTFPSVDLYSVIYFDIAKECQKTTPLIFSYSYGAVTGQWQFGDYPFTD